MCKCIFVPLSKPLLPVKTWMVDWAMIVILPLWMSIQHCCLLSTTVLFFPLFSYSFFFSNEVSSAFFHQRSLVLSRKFKLAVKRLVPLLGVAICPLLQSPYLLICVMPANTHEGVCVCVCVCVSECSMMGPSCSSLYWLFSCCWDWCWCGGSGLCAVQWYVLNVIAVHN